MFKTITRVLIILALVCAMVWLFAPRILNNAANSLLSSANASVSQAQGLAQFLPASVNTNKGSGDLQIQLSNLDPNVLYDIVLEQDSCGNTGQDLGGFTSDENGNIYTVIPLKTLDTQKNWFVDVHQQNSVGMSVACGQLETNQTSSSQVIQNTQDGPNVFGVQPSPTPTSPTTSDGSLSNDTTDQSQSTQSPPTLPNTGVSPGTNQSYDNSQYPRKY